MKADMTLKLLKIEIDDIDLHKPYESVQIRTAAKLHVTNYEESPLFKENFLWEFYKEVYLLISSLTSYFIEKSSLKHLIIWCSSCFN